MPPGPAFPSSIARGEGRRVSPRRCAQADNPLSTVIPANAGIQWVALGPRLRGDDDGGVFAAGERFPLPVSRLASGACYLENQGPIRHRRAAGGRDAALMSGHTLFLTGHLAEKRLRNVLGKLGTLDF